MCCHRRGGPEHSHPAEEPLTTELKAFLDSMRNRSKPLADGQAGFEALKIVEVCYESSRSGGGWRLNGKKSDQPRPKPRPAGGVKGHNMNDITMPGSPGLWAGSFPFGERS